MSLGSWSPLSASVVCSSLLLIGNVQASNIDLSLNLRYNHPADLSQGGIWSLVGLTDDLNGIASVRAILDNVDNGLGDVAFPSGIGAVDPVDLGGGPRPAVIGNGTILDLAYGQDLVGTVIPGVGAGLGAPGDIGLVPLYNGDWSHASVLASGTFSSSTRPTFTMLGGDFSSGSLLNSTVGQAS